MIGQDELTIFLCGDVMTGRGVDQVLPRPCPPGLHERFVSSALEYVELAERANGPIPRAVEPTYPWGDALDVLDELSPAARVINLETSITTSEEAEPKGVNYRMHPANAGVLTAAAVDCCVLANNHVLDWGEAGLLDTLETLANAGIRAAGAGPDRAAAEAPAVIEAGHGIRVLIFAYGAADSGIPQSWAATSARPGVHLIPDFSDETANALGRIVEGTKRPGDIAVASMHWGANWGYAIPPAHRRFAHALIDRAQIDVVYGHSSHHPKAIEVYRDRPILYGSGDFINDYEGISGYEEFRGDLVLMYFLTIDPQSGRLVQLRLQPLQVRNFRLNRAAAADVATVQETLDRECRRFGHRVEAVGDRLLFA